MKPKRKMMMMEIETNLTNKDIKDEMKWYFNDDNLIKLIQIDVNVIKDTKKK